MMAPACLLLGHAVLAQMPGPGLVILGARLFFVLRGAGLARVTPIPGLRPACEALRPSLYSLGALGLFERARANFGHCRTPARLRIGVIGLLRGERQHGVRQMWQLMRALLCLFAARA